jgi:aldehyde:ferredoxin oxidoreductase
MGSKNLKAIAVRGTGGIKTADPKKFLSTAMELNDRIKNSDMSVELSRYGTVKIMNRMAGAGRPYRNFQTLATYEGKLKPIDVLDKYSPKKVGCFNCPNRCMEAYDVVGVGSGVISCTFYGAVGMTIDTMDPEVFLRSALYCQKQGMDVAAAGGLLAWAMELYERGIITTEDTDGIPMAWGSEEAISGMMQKIVRREGFGDVLADGCLIGAERIGRGAGEYAMHCKGLPLFIESPIIEKGKALAMAVGPRGDHYRGYPIVEAGIHRFDHSELEGEELRIAKEKLYQQAEEICGTRKGAVPDEYEGKPLMIKYSEDTEAITDALGICKWATPRQGIDAYTPEEQARLLSLGMGTEITVHMLFEAADRMRCMERAFSVREGLTREEERLPNRMYELITEDGLTLSLEKVEEMITQYYAARGWDPDTGVPTRKTLERLGLAYVAEDLEKRGKLNTERPEKNQS